MGHIIRYEDKQKLWEIGENYRSLNKLQLRSLCLSEFDEQSAQPSHIVLVHAELRYWVDGIVVQ